MKTLLSLLLLCALAFTFDLSDYNLPEIPPLPEIPDLPRPSDVIYKDILDYVDYDIPIIGLTDLSAIGAAFVRSLRALPRFTVVDAEDFAFDPHSVDRKFIPLDENDEPNIEYLLGVASTASLPALLLSIFTITFALWIIWNVLKVLTLCCCCLPCRRCKKTKKNANFCCRGFFFILISFFLIGIIMAHSGNIAQHGAIKRFTEFPEYVDPFFDLAVDTTRDAIETTSELVTILSNMADTIIEILPDSTRLQASFVCITNGLMGLPNISVILTELEKVEDISSGLPDKSILEEQVDKLFFAKGLAPDPNDLYTFVSNCYDAVEILSPSFLESMKERVDNIDSVAVILGGSRDVNGDENDDGLIYELTVSIDNLAGVLATIKLSDDPVDPEIKGTISKIAALVSGQSDLTVPLEALLDGQSSDSLIKCHEFISSLVEIFDENIDGETFIAVIEAYINGADKLNALPFTDSSSYQSNCAANYPVLSELQIIVSNWKETSLVSPVVGQLGDALDTNRPDFSVIHANLVAIQDVLATVNAASVDSIIADLNAINIAIGQIESALDETTGIPNQLNGISTELDKFSTLSTLESNIEDVIGAIDKLPNMNDLAQMVRDLMSALIEMPDFGPESPFVTELSKIDTLLDNFPDLSLVAAELNKTTVLFDILGCADDVIEMILDLNHTLIEFPDMVDSHLEMYYSITDMINELDIDEYLSLVSEFADLEVPDTTEIDNILEQLLEIAGVIDDFNLEGMDEKIEAVGVNVEAIKNLNLDQILENLASIQNSLDNAPDLSEISNDFSSLTSVLNDLPELGDIVTELEALKTSLADFDSSLLQDSINQLEPLKTFEFPVVEEANYQPAFDAIDNVKTLFTDNWATCESCFEDCSSCSAPCESFLDNIAAQTIETAFISQVVETDSTLRNVPDLSDAANDLSDVHSKLDIELGDLDSLNDVASELNSLDLASTIDELTDVRKSLLDRPDLQSVSNNINSAKHAIDSLGSLESIKENSKIYRDSFDEIGDKDDLLNQLDALDVEIPSMTDILGMLQIASGMMEMIPQGEELSIMIDEGQVYLDMYHDLPRIKSEAFEIVDDYKTVIESRVDEAVELYDDIKTSEALEEWNSLLDSVEAIRIYVFLVPFVFALFAFIIGVCSITCTKCSPCFCVFNFFTILSGILLSILAIVFIVLSVSLGDACHAWESKEVLEYIPDHPVSVSLTADLGTIRLESTRDAAEYYLFCDSNKEPLDIGLGDVYDRALDLYLYEYLNFTYEMPEYNVSLSINSLRPNIRVYIDQIIDWISISFKDFVMRFYGKLMSCVTLSPVISLISEPLCEYFVPGFGLYALGCVLCSLFGFIAICSGCFCASPSWKKKEAQYANKNSTETELQPMVLQPQLAALNFSLQSLPTGSVPVAPFVVASSNVRGPILPQ
ncbi:hypothetical protein RCL1_004177 [Eukaryota sp. TZLM3-RCL]